MKLYIVRHGQTELNLKHILQGNLDSPLTEKGIIGAEKIREELKNIEFDKVITSNLNRAIKTAEIILAEREDQFIQDADVGEMAFGVWQGKSQEEISTSKETGENYINYFKYPDKYIPPKGAESYEHLIQRAQHFLEGMKTYARKNPKANVLLVSHGAFIKAILGVIHQASIKDFWGEPYVTNCSITMIDISGGEYTILKEADVSHLGEHKIMMSASGYVK